jgi:hypothetical protein
LECREPLPASLLAALGTAEFQRAVTRADIITISIGGNNLLRPIRESVAAAFGAAGLTPNLENPMEIKAAIAAIAAAKSAELGDIVTPEQVWQEIITGLITLQQPILADKYCTESRRSGFRN